MATHAKLQENIVVMNCIIAILGVISAIFGIIATSKQLESQNDKYQDIRIELGVQEEKFKNCNNLSSNCKRQKDSLNYRLTQLTNNRKTCKEKIKDKESACKTEKDTLNKKISGLNDQLKNNERLCAKNAKDIEKQCNDLAQRVQDSKTNCKADGEYKQRLDKCENMLSMQTDTANSLSKTLETTAKKEAAQLALTKYIYSSNEYAKQHYSSSPHVRMNEPFKSDMVKDQPGLYIKLDMLVRTGRILDFSPGKYEFESTQKQRAFENIIEQISHHVNQFRTNGFGENTIRIYIRGKADSTRVKEGINVKGDEYQYFSILPAACGFVPCREFVNRKEPFEFFEKSIDWYAQQRSLQPLHNRDLPDLRARFIQYALELYGYQSNKDTFILQGETTLNKNESRDRQVEVFLFIGNQRIAAKADFSING